MAGGEEAHEIAARVQGVALREQLYEQLVTTGPTIETCTLRMKVTSVDRGEEDCSDWLLCNALTMTEEMKR